MPPRIDRDCNIAARSEAITPTKIAFIGRGGTASASESVINNMLPYLGNNVALVGTNTFGKPVGQAAFDREECDDRLRPATFRGVNANDEGEYFDGLADVVPNTCRASDDIFTPLGDPTEASIATVLDFLAGRSCTAIAAACRKSTIHPGSKMLRCTCGIWTSTVSTLSCIVSMSSGSGRRDKISPHPAHLIDLLPTLAQVAGIEEDPEWEGASLFEPFLPEELKTRELGWEHEGNRAIRMGDWRLVATGRHGQDERY